MKVLCVSGIGQVCHVIVRKVHEALLRAGIDSNVFIQESFEDFDKTIEFIQPTHVFTLDYVIARDNIGYFYVRGIKHVTWWIDNPAMFGISNILPDDKMLTVDKGWTDYLTEMGAKDVTWLPLCTDPDDEIDTSMFEHSEVSFVGNPRDANEIFKIMPAFGFNTDVVSSMNDLMSFYYENPLAPLEMPSYLDCFHTGMKNYVMGQLKEKSCSSFRIEGVKNTGAVVYGGDDWLKHIGEELVKPKVAPETELKSVYATTDINLNFTAGQMHTGCNQRVFDAPLAGGFVITPKMDELSELFNDDEVISYSTMQELIEKVDYFKDHPDIRGDIVERARERILKEHTYDHRVSVIIDALTT